MIIRLDHIAILTTSLEESAAQMPPAFRSGDVREYPEEGTREQYVFTGDEEGPSLLFLQAIRSGPYMRALQKRGPGLHHLGCVTDSLIEAVRHFAATGLLLHPVSLETRRSNVVWLCRPGVPYLVELYSAAEGINRRQLDIRVELPVPKETSRCVHRHVPGVVVRCMDHDTIRISIDGRWFSVKP